MNKILFMLLIGLSIFPISNLAYSQIAYDPYAMAQTGFSGATGLTMIKGEDGELTPFYRLQLRPEINLDKIGVGFDAVLLYNPDKDIRSEDGEKWDSWRDYIRAIRYFRYGHRRDSLYFVYGALDNMYIGHGLIMGGYSNYDRRGLRFDVNTKVLGAETILNNLAESNIFGGRIYLRPFQILNIAPLINRLTFGATYITDIDPNPESDSEDSLIAYSLDLSIPIIKALGLEIYNELASLRGLVKSPRPPLIKGEVETGVGYAVGTGMEIFSANFKIEYRILNEYFQPTPFDYTYEASKPLKFTAKGQQKGIYSLLAYNLPQKIWGAIAYEDYNLSDPNLYGEIVEIGLIDKMSLRAFYVKRGIEDFKDIFDLDEKSAFTVRIGFEVFSPLELAVSREFRFREREDGKGFETISKTSFELGVNVQF
ncbi:hypothetical protein FJZ31_11845 [Candidatus Poribacteria bacterium]|nr:hypothetical protein [Candidatus Poribacteria bacterium]